MATQNTNELDEPWTIFFDILNDEFIEKTGFGVYVYITPIDAITAYQQYQLRNDQIPMRLFISKYVQPFTIF